MIYVVIYHLQTMLQVEDSTSIVKITQGIIHLEMFHLSLVIQVARLHLHLN